VTTTFAEMPLRNSEMIGATFVTSAGGVIVSVGLSAGSQKIQNVEVAGVGVLTTA
jgi:hypothetical protein